MPTEFYFEIQYFNFYKKVQSHFFRVTETLNSDKADSSQCYSESESETAALIPIQQLFQHSSQPECFPADVGSNGRIDQISGPVFSKPVLLLVVYEVVSPPVPLSSKNVIICPIAIAYSMGQIIKSFCVCPCVRVCVCVRLWTLSRSHFFDFYQIGHRRVNPQK